jgi:hypothetical protein
MRSIRSEAIAGEAPPGPAPHRERARAKRVANALDALGAGRGDRVATLAWNGWRHLDIYYDVTSLGPFPANKGINRIAAEGRREPTYAEIVNIGDVSMKWPTEVLNAKSTRGAKLV